MKTTILISVFLLSGLLLRAQVPSFGWAKSIGSSDLEMPNKVLSDAAGNVFVLGSYKDAVDFDPGPGTYTMVPSSGNTDEFLLKLDASGNFVWAKSFGSAFSVGSFQSCMSFDATGNIVIAGMYTGTADFNPGPATYTLGSTNGNYGNGFVLKLDAGGNFLWAKSVEGVTSAGMLAFSGIQVDAGNNINILGYYTDLFDFDPNPVVTYTLTPPSPMYYSCAVLKLNSTGDFIWAKSISNVINAIGIPNLSLTADQQGNVLLSGSFEGTVDFDPGVATYTIASNGTSFQGTSFVTKLDVNGNFAWAVQTEGTWSTNKDLICDNNGNVYVCGQGATDTDLDPGPAVISSPGTTALDQGYFFKLSPTGSFVWGNFISGDNTSNCESLSLNNTGDLFVLGSYAGTFDFDGGPGTYMQTSTSAAYYETESFICSYNAAGSFLWANQFGGVTGGFSLPTSIAVSNTNIYVAGYFDTAADYDPTAGISILPFAGFMDTYILKLSTCMAPPSPTNTTIPARLSICAGATTTLSASTSTGTVNWYTSPTSLTTIGSGTMYVTPALAAGTYTYYADATTCGSSMPRIAITVTATPFPFITASTFSSTICSGSTVTLTASAPLAVSYSWSTGASTASITVSPTVTTTYTVTGTNACATASTSITQYVSTCTGIDEFINADAISIYPNPVNDHVSIAIPTQLLSSLSSIEVSDALGKLVMKETLSHEINTFNISTLEAGVYFFKVINNSQTIKVGKVLKQ